MTEVSAADRALVRERALGRCEYCRLPESLGFVEHQIDHIIAIKHGGGSEPGNLALSCTLCNRYKGSDIASIDPDTALIASLFHRAISPGISTSSYHRGALSDSPHTGKLPHACSSSTARTVWGNVRSFRGLGFCGDQQCA